RFIASNPNLKMPFKRYQIGPVFRDGPIKLGRYRQFWQCDVDVVGVKSMGAEAELLALTSAGFKKLGFNVIIKVNNRKLLDGILEYCGVKEKEFETTILSLDKLEKFGKDYVKRELKDKKIKQADKILKTIIQTLPKLKKLLKDNQGIKELEELFKLLKSYNVKAEFDPSLARGLSYYTGTVFEVFMKKSELKSSIAAGGRYDNMIPQFIGTKNQYPAVGISFGLDVITDAVKLKAKKSVADIFIIPIGTEKKCVKIAESLRKRGIKTELDLAGKGVSKNLGYANTLEIPYVLFVGEDELKKKKVKLRDMKTGEEKLVKVENVKLS
ncbi:histidine--tRNA ligase, partial [Candidatus Woesearchaeota archaeon]|nr:histidine--tRNA ligase [Candidatus Woesearchaeota archaeon]